MKLRELGLWAQEFEAGPYRFLLSHSIPVAYRHDGQAYRTDRYFSKAVTRHLNKWLLEDPKPTMVSQDAIVAAFEGISRYSDAPQLERRLSGRRQDDTVSVKQFVETLMRLAAESDR